MNKILINAIQQEEMRIATIDGQKLINLDIEVASVNQKKGDLYKGTIVRIEPSLEAAFVDYGSERHGFLSFKEISKSYYKNTQDLQERPTISNSIREGQQVLVQITREELGNKGAALTTYISLASRYLVLMPNSPHAGGISRRIAGKDRDEARDILKKIPLDENEGIIVRTASLGQEMKTLEWDVEYLRKIWDAIITAAKSKPAPFLIYQESNFVICYLRDSLNENISEIIVDNEEIYETVEKFLTMIMPEHKNKLKLYQEGASLFNSYHIEKQIETVYQHEVRLPSGGSIVFDQTEALISIDINSGKATKGKDIEATALATNIEACEEIARQLHMRDLGGLIVIDLIDMMSSSNQRTVENALRQFVQADRARIQIGSISRFGLLEMSRQRLRMSLKELSNITCPRCSGIGSIRTNKSCALAALRLIEEEALQKRGGKIIPYLPIEVASFLLNEKRSIINEISTHFNCEIIIIPDANLETPHFRITHIRTDNKETFNKNSYEHIPTPKLINWGNNKEKKTAQTRQKKPMLDVILPNQPAPIKGWLANFFSSFRTTKKPQPSSRKQNHSRPYKSSNAHDRSSNAHDFQKRTPRNSRQQTSRPRVASDSNQTKSMKPSSKVANRTSDKTTKQTNKMINKPVEKAKISSERRNNMKRGENNHPSQKTQTQARPKPFNRSNHQKPQMGATRQGNANLSYTRAATEEERKMHEDFQRNQSMHEDNLKSDNADKNQFAPEAETSIEIQTPSKIEVSQPPQEQVTEAQNMANDFVQATKPITTSFEKPKNMVQVETDNT